MKYACRGKLKYASYLIKMKNAKWQLKMKYAEGS